MDLNPNQNNIPPIDSRPPQFTPPPVTSAPQRHSTGALVGSLVVIVLIILAGFYFWGERVSKQDMYKETGDISETQNEAAAEAATIEKITTQSSSDDISSIEADLNSTTFSDFDTEFEKIDTELGE